MPETTQSGKALRDRAGRPLHRGVAEDLEALLQESVGALGRGAHRGQELGGHRRDAIQHLVVRAVGDHGVPQVPQGRRGGQAGLVVWVSATAGCAVVVPPTSLCGAALSMTSAADRSSPPAPGPPRPRRPEGSGSVERRHLVGGELEVGRLGRGHRGLGAARAGDRDDPVALGQHPGQGDLLGADAPGLCHLGEGRMALGQVGRVADAPERAPGEEGQAQLLAVARARLRTSGSRARTGSGR